MAMIFIVLLLILGGNAVKTVVLEERMSGNMRDENLSFQAAEAALAAAENYLGKTAQSDLPDTHGVYPLINGAPNTRLPAGDPGSRAYWTDNWGAIASTQISVPLQGVNMNAYYVIEQLQQPISIGDPSAVPIVEAYRITARATGGTNNAVTLLQTTYTR